MLNDRVRRALHTVLSLNMEGKVWPLYHWWKVVGFEFGKMSTRNGVENGVWRRFSVWNCCDSGAVCNCQWETVHPIGPVFLRHMKDVTLHPASSFRRHDGRRSLAWLFIADVVDTLLATWGWYNEAAVDSVFLSDSVASLASRPALESSEHLLASLRSLSANDNELALSMSSNDRFCMATLPFLSSSVMPMRYKLSLSGSVDSLVNSESGLVGDVLVMDNISKSVFLVTVDEEMDDITAGTLIVTDADDALTADRLFGSTSVTDVTISSSSVLILALVTVSLSLTLVVVFPFCFMVVY